MSEIKTWLWIHRVNLLDTVDMNEFDPDDYRYDEYRRGYWIKKSSHTAVLLILKGQEFDRHWRLHYQNGVLV